MTTHLPVYDLTLPGPSAFTVGTYRSFTARDGYGYAATLLRDGTEVARLFDDGDGGAAYAHWSHEDARAQFLDLAAVFPAGAGSMPADLCPIARNTDMVEEWLIGEFASHEYLRRSLDRATRTATAVLLPGQAAADAWTKIKAPYSERVEAYLRSHYGTGNVRLWTSTGWTTVH
jgi:hypothetical protein